MRKVGTVCAPRVSAPFLLLVLVLWVYTGLALAAGPVTPGDSRGLVPTGTVPDLPVQVHVEISQVTVIPERYLAGELLTVRVAFSALDQARPYQLPVPDLASWSYRDDAPERFAELVSVELRQRGGATRYLEARCIAWMPEQDWLLLPELDGLRFPLISLKPDPAPPLTGDPPVLGPVDAPGFRFRMYLALAALGALLVLAVITALSFRRLRSCWLSWFCAWRAKRRLARALAELADGDSGVEAWQRFGIVCRAFLHERLSCADAGVWMRTLIDPGRLGPDLDPEAGVYAVPYFPALTASEVAVILAPFPAGLSTTLPELLARSEAVCWLGKSDPDLASALTATREWQAGLEQAIRARPETRSVLEGPSSAGGAACTA